MNKTNQTTYKVTMHFKAPHPYNWATISVNAGDIRDALDQVIIMYNPDSIETILIEEKNEQNKSKRIL
jgi:hypothetical protein